MPKMTGFELISYIRSSHSSPKLPIIVITTKGEEQSCDQGLALGANAYLSKPISGAKLQLTVKKASRWSGSASQVADPGKSGRSASR